MFTLLLYFKPKKFKKLIDFPSPTWYHVFLSLILSMQGKWLEDFQLIIIKPYSLKDILRYNTPLTRETTLTGKNCMHYHSFTKWSCLRRFLSNFVLQYVVWKMWVSTTGIIWIFLEHYFHKSFEIIHLFYTF